LITSEKFMMAARFDRYHYTATYRCRDLISRQA